MKRFTVIYEDNYGVRGSWSTQAKSKNDAREEFRRGCSAIWFTILWVNEG